MSEEVYKCVIVLGPTATGKTGLGVNLARRFNGEVISADSRQVYKGMDIGTGKDLKDFGEGDNFVPYHLMDVAEPTEVFDLYKYVVMATEALKDITARGKMPFFIGGTSLYLDAFLKRYVLEGGEQDPEFRATLENVSDAELLTMLEEQAPELKERTDCSQRARIVRALEIIHTRGGRTPVIPPKIDPLIIGPYFHRKIVHERIEKRLDERFAEGMVDEVKYLHDEKGVSWEKLDFFGLEYRYIAQYLQGKLSFEEMRETLFIHIRKFCKRQDIWFRKMEREGKVIHWIPDGNLRVAVGLVQTFLAGGELPEPILRIDDITYGPRTGS